MVRLIFFLFFEVKIKCEDVFCNMFFWEGCFIKFSFCYDNNNKCLIEKSGSVRCLLGSI